MKKKLLLTGLVIVATAAVSSGATVAAYDFLNQTRNIYTVSNPDQCEMSWKSGGKGACSTVSTFDDRGNKCYVAVDKNGNEPSISCVRMK